MAIGSKEIRAYPEPWAEASFHVGGLSPVLDDRLIFHAALGGLLASSELSLVQLGEFCSEVVEGMSSRGLAIRDAMGFAMPCARSEEHTSELQSLMRISYAVFCLKKKT